MSRTLLSTPPVPPSAYDHHSYVSHLLRRARDRSTIIYGTAWCPDGRYLLASSNFGEVLVWNFGRTQPPSRVQKESDGTAGRGGYFSEDYWTRGDDREDRDGGADRRRPVLRIRISEEDSALYDIKLQKICGELRVIVSGDVGVRVYRWSDFLARLQEADDTDEIEDVPSVSVPVAASFLPHPSATERRGVEINSVSVDEGNGRLFAAAGDMFGCYRWDMATGNLLGTLSGKHTDYLHAVHVVEGARQVLTGGEDGKMGIWDSHSGSLVEMVDFCKTFSRTPPPPPPLPTSAPAAPSSFKWGSDTHLWLAGFDTDAGGDWAALCGGAEGSRVSSAGIGGFVSIWHLPSRTLSTTSVVAEGPQAVMFHDGHVVTTGNRGVVRRWNGVALKSPTQALSRVRSGFSLSINPANGAMVVAGANSLLDCFMFPGSRSFSVSV